MESLDWKDVLLRLVVAALCGAPIGWERGRNAHAAGLRTQILISVGAAAFIVIALRWKPEAPRDGMYQLDPMRVMQGIVNGVGLLAGGAIIRARGHVRGLTTAATVWAVTAVGVACGFGQFDVAVILMVITLIVTIWLVRIDPKERGRRILITGESPDQRSG